MSFGASLFQAVFVSPVLLCSEGGSYAAAGHAPAEVNLLHLTMEEIKDTDSCLCWLRLGWCIGCGRGQSGPLVAGRYLPRPGAQEGAEGHGARSGRGCPGLAG